MLMISLIGCAQTPQQINSCPVWPDPSPGVADELKENCIYTVKEAQKMVCRREDKCRATWEWLDRLYVLKDQLSVSQSLENR